MKAYIQAFCDEPWSIECSKAKSGFEKFGVECVLFNNTDELSDASKEDIVIGGLLILSHQFNRFSIELPDLNYPDELNFCFGRHIWQERLGDLRKGIFRDQQTTGFPVFMKPLEEKVCTGEIIDGPDALHEYSTLSDDAIILCSDPVNFVSEWRCYVRYGQIQSICHYNGDSEVECDRSVVEHVVKAYQSAPTGYAIDFGITDDGRTLLVEVNDGFALGDYGVEDFLYAQMLSARWAEMFGVQDYLKDAFVLRILERFKIKQRGEVYAVRIESGLPNRPRMNEVFLTQLEENSELTALRCIMANMKQYAGTQNWIVTCSVCQKASRLTEICLFRECSIMLKTAVCCSKT